MEKNKENLQAVRTECHFCSVKKSSIVCMALTDFYNAEKPEKERDLCGGCPFFKTEREFWDGWKRRKK